MNVALHAHALLHRDVDYIVRDGAVELIDEMRGRVAQRRRWPDGLQAAVEAKEGLNATAEGEVLVRNRFLSLDPYMRMRMSDARSYAPSAELGQVMVGGTILSALVHPWFYVLVAATVGVLVLAANRTTTQAIPVKARTSGAFPLRVSLQSPDGRLDLGATRFQVFREVELPLAMPGILIGFLLTFVLAVGAIAEAKVLGGQKIIPVAHDIEIAFTYAQNWPLGAALSVLLIVVVGVAVIAVLRRFDLDTILGRR